MATNDWDKLQKKVYEIGDSLFLFVEARTVYSKLILFNVYKNKNSRDYVDMIVDLDMTDEQIVDYLLECKESLYGDELQETDSYSP